MAEPEIVEAEIVEGSASVSADANESEKHDARDSVKAELLDLMSHGKTLTECCRVIDGISFSTVWRWRQADKAFDADYMEARKAMSDALADDALTRVKEAGPGNWQAAHAYSQRASWYASKMLPKLYGDAPAQVNIDNRTQVVVLSDEKRQELQDRLKRLQLESNESNQD